MRVGSHRLIVDEPVDAGGMDSGPTPYDLIAAGLGACTAMTVRLYASAKEIPLERIAVELQHKKIYAADCAACDTKEGKIDRIERLITLEGELDDATKAKLLEIADKCPVHRTLNSEMWIPTRAGVRQPAGTACLQSTRPHAPSDVRHRAAATHSVDRCFRRPSRCR